MSRGIKTEVAGVTLRSRPEAYWALFFEHLGIEWQYEPRKFEMGDTTYTPDFYLPQSRMWVEVKAYDGDLKEKFPKYVEAVATVLSGSAGLLLLNQNTFRQCRNQTPLSAYPIHTALVPDPDSRSGVSSASALFEKTGPVVLDGTNQWVFPDSFSDRRHETRLSRHIITGEIMEVKTGNLDLWTGVTAFEKIAYLPSKVREAYLLDHHSILESNPVNVEHRQEGLSALTPARIKGVGIMLNHLNEYIALDGGDLITWTFIEGMHSESRKREWHVQQGKWSQVFKLQEIEPFLLHAYLSYDIELPMAKLAQRRQPGYCGYLTKKLTAISNGA